MRQLRVGQAQTEARVASVETKVENVANEAKSTGSQVSMLLAMFQAQFPTAAAAVSPPKRARSNTQSPRRNMENEDETQL